MSEESKELIKQIKLLNSNIETLAKVIAVDIGKEELLKGKETKEAKIEVLDKIGIPRTIIAIMIGSTPESVSAFKSMKREPKNKKKKGGEQK
jgi:hypothetical protein